MQHTPGINSLPIPLEFQTHASLAAVSAAEFRGLEGPDAFPFLSHEFLSALEDTGVVSSNTGWTPRHLAVRSQGRLVLFCPAYEKTHSMGEFVFDHSLGEFSELRLGVPYYPKWVFAVPFTPATGPRFLWAAGLPSEVRAAITREALAFARRTAQEEQLSSVHVLFPDVDQTSQLADCGLSVRSGVQFQWHRQAEQNFDDFLAGFSSKRRHAIRRERALLRVGGYRIEAGTASDLGELDAGLLYRIYLSTVDKYYYGRRYLNQAFFEALLAKLPESVHLVFALDSAGRRVAGAINLLGRDALFGRYWGTFDDAPFLHFEVCLYSGIEETLRLGRRRFEPGAGGEHKESRGFSRTRTSSAHWFRDERLHAISSDFFRREAMALFPEA